jgi:hypothetical protein
MFLSLAFCGAAAAVEIKNEYFQLNLPGDWHQEKGASPEQFIVVSDSRRAQITISYVPLTAEDTDLQRVADKLLELRLQAEREAAPDRTVSLGKPWSSRPADGGVQINYFGHDSLGRHFFFAGFVTKTHAVSVTGEIEYSSERSIQEFYKEVLSHFGY